MCETPYTSLTRRLLLKRTATLAAGLTLSTGAGAALSQVAGDFPDTRTDKQFGTGRRTAQMFALDKVTLAEGPFHDNMERNRVYVLSLDPDRFLYWYRVSAGLEPKAKAYGAWEEKVGRMLGHYLSACSMYARATAEPAFQQRQSYVVSQLAECQKANGDGYVGGLPEGKRIFAEIAQGKIYFVSGRLNGVHAPWYMLHKMIAGLRDAYVYAGNEQALAVLTGFSDWAYDLTGKLSSAQMQTMLTDEHGGPNEVFADMYAIAGKDKYLALSRRFNRAAVLDPLQMGQDDLNGLHANTQIPTVLGLYRQYELSGDAGARRGGEFFWRNVVTERSYANGGDSDKEHFYPVGQMGQNLSAATAETCNSYNMVKLTDRLFAGTPREELAAYNERVLWNHILASLDRTTPGMTYYLSLKPGHFKTFSKPFDSFWCCVGTGMENHAKYGESIYFHSADELWVNQFIASEVLWDAKGMRIIQSTRFPTEEQSQWTIHCAHATRATLSIRHPKWAGAAFALKVNGKTAGRSEPGSYHRLQRTWHDGDVITASLPLRLSVEPMRDEPSLKAIFAGPLLLAGLLGREGMADGVPYAAGEQLQFQHIADPEVPALQASGVQAETWLRAEGSLRYTASAANGAVVPFVPLANISRDRYSVYWRFV